MTTLVIIIYGLAFVLILSAMETDANGNDVSLVQTVQDIWNGTLEGSVFGKPASNGGGSAGGYTSIVGSLPAANNANGGPSGNRNYLAA